MIELAAFSADGTRVAAASQDGNVRVWDTASGDAVASFSPGAVDALVLSSNGERAFAAGAKGAITWDTKAGRQISALAGQSGRIVAAEFDDEARSLLTVAVDGSARIWDVGAGRTRRELLGVEPQLPSVGTGRLGKSLFAIAGFSAEDDADQPRAGTALFALGDGLEVRIWDPALHRVVRVLRGHTSEVTGTAFDRRGRFIATASDDYTARVWDALTGRSVALLRGHQDFVNAVAFGPDGMTLGTASFDNRAHIYRCEVCGDADYLLNLAKERVRRPLTDAERQEYLR